MLASRMGFVGVDTRHSSIVKVLPLWADALGLPSRELRGFDLSLDAISEQYRAVVSVIRDDPEQAGALVTTHKMRIYEAAHDVFDSCDRFAVAWGEVSPSPKTAGRYSVTPKTRSPLALLSTQSSQKLTSRQQARQSCAWARVARERPSRGTWPTEQTGPKGWSSRLIGKSASTAPGRFTNGAD